MEITLTVPDELANRLGQLGENLPRVLELGLREWNAQQGAAFSGLAEVPETLASLPTPEEILALRPAAALQERIDELLEKSQNDGLPAEATMVGGGDYARGIGGTAPQRPARTPSRK